MTLTIHLPDKPAAQFLALMPEEKRDEFIAEAIADAVALRQDETREAEARLLAVLRAELDPEKEPERDAAECRATVEEA